MKKLALLLFGLSIISASFSQQNYMTRSGYLKFYSHTAIEDITAENNDVGSIINSTNGEVVITLKMTDFKFEKKLMQEHFNENYVESEKFPKATFKGFITDNEKVDYSTKGVYEVSVSGDMTIHGVTNEVSSKGTIEVIKNGIIAKTKFMLNPENYDIKIPKVVRKNIAENMEIIADMKYSSME
jgi:polyisoprenoid-binding protein YceI